MARKRRIYTPEFKAEAVKLVIEQGYSVAEAARSLGIHETLLRSWKQALEAQGDQAFPGHGKLPPFEEELRRLRVENQRLRDEISRAQLPRIQIQLLHRLALTCALRIRRRYPLAFGVGAERTSCAWAEGSSRLSHLFRLRERRRRSGSRVLARRRARSVRAVSGR